MSDKQGSYQRLALSAQDVTLLLRDIAGSLVAEHWELKIETLEHRSCRMRLIFDKRHTRPGGTIMGAAQFHLADVAAYAVIIGAVGHAATAAVTSSHAMNYLRRPGATDLICAVRLIKLGRRMAVCQAEIYPAGSEHEDAMLAQATLTYAMP